MIIIINCCWILHVDKNGSSSGWVLECCVSSMCRSITVIIFTVKSWCMVVLFLCCSYNLIQLLLTTGVGWYVKTLQPEAFSKPMLNQRLHSGVCVCVCVCVLVQDCGVCMTLHVHLCDEQLLFSLFQFAGTMCLLSTKLTRIGLVSFDQ